MYVYVQWSATRADGLAHLNGNLIYSQHVHSTYER